MAKEFDFKGTQGKWEIIGEPTLEKMLTDETEEFCGGFDVLQRDSNIKIVSVPAYSFWGQDFKSAKANALLISKAPEMLEMLKIGKQVLEDFGLDVEQLLKEATTL